METGKEMLPILEVWMILMGGWNWKNGFLVSEASDGENWIPGLEGAPTGLRQSNRSKFWDASMRCW